MYITAFGKARGEYVTHLSRNGGLLVVSLALKEVLNVSHHSSIIPDESQVGSDVFWRCRILFVLSRVVGVEATLVVIVEVHGLIAAIAAASGLFGQVYHIARGDAVEGLEAQVVAPAVTAATGHPYDVAHPVGAVDAVVVGKGRGAEVVDALQVLGPPSRWKVSVPRESVLPSLRMGRLRRSST